jgi:hypothetical protein
VRGGAQKREDIIARDPEAIAYDRCARALAHMRNRLNYNMPIDDTSERAAGRVIALLADRFNVKVPATTLRVKVEE